MRVGEDILRVIRATAKAVRVVTWKRIRLTQAQTCALCWTVIEPLDWAWFCREQMVCECRLCRAEADRADNARREGGPC